MEELLDRIYEAAFVPETWPETLDTLSAPLGSIGGAVLATGNRHPPRWAASDVVAPALRNYVESGAWTKNNRPEQILASGHTGFSRDIDLWTDDELDRYRAMDRREQHGLGWQLGCIVPMPSGETFIVTFDRRFEDGPHGLAMRDAADRLRPHLARAGLMAARFGLERARTTVSALAAVGLPAAVLSGSGRVIAVNGLLEGMTSVFLPAAHARLAIADLAADALLQEVIADYRRHGIVARSIPMPGTIGHGPMVLHVLPVRRTAHDIFPSGEILVAATLVGIGQAVPSLAMLHGLFDLAPSEARLAASLAAGLPLKAAAAQQQIQLSTARSYLETIFRKTGTRQQSQLVALLKSAQPLTSSVDPRDG